ncbi:MAG: hypothetical protein K0B07_02260 [DPANN group archaeon]|nr:hypothetical protein [DPANN group archaeon]
MEVLSETKQTLITDSRIYGGKSTSSPCGYTSRLILEVKPVNTFLPVKTLYFDGISIVEAGNYISAKIPRCDIETIFSGSLLTPYRRHKELYFDREFKDKESAIELSIFGRDSKSLLRKDRAIDYGMFIKE